MLLAAGCIAAVEPWTDSALPAHDRALSSPSHSPAERAGLASGTTTRCSPGTWKTSGRPAHPFSPLRACWGQQVPGPVDRVGSPMAHRCSVFLAALVLVLLSLLFLLSAFPAGAGARRLDRGPWSWRRRCRGLLSERRPRHRLVDHRLPGLGPSPVVRVKRVFRGGLHKRRKHLDNSVDFTGGGLCQRKSALRRTRVWRSGTRKSLAPGVLPPARDLGESRSFCRAGGGFPTLRRSALCRIGREYPAKASPSNATNLVSSPAALHLPKF